MEPTATRPWCDGQPSCTDAPFDVFRESARWLGPVEVRQWRLAERPMASGTLAPLDVALTAEGQVAHGGIGMWHFGAADQFVGWKMTQYLARLPAHALPSTRATQALHPPKETATPKRHIATNASARRPKPKAVFINANHRTAPKPKVPRTESASRTGRFQDFSGMGPQKQIAFTVVQ